MKKSRWDAVKPESFGHAKREKKALISNVNVSQSSSAAAAAASAESLRSPDDIQRDFLRAQQAYLQSGAGADTLAPLVAQIQKDAREKALGSLLADCVLQVLLPRLEEIGGSSNGSDHHDDEETKQLFRSIRFSLQNDVTASALLAPTIDEVGADGTERQRTNPWAVRLTKIIAAEFVQPRNRSFQDAAECLSSVLKNRSRFEKTKSLEKKTTLDFDPRIVYKALEKVWERQDNEESHSILTLIQVLVTKYPEASSSLLSHLLMPKTVWTLNVKRCLCCGVHLHPLPTWLFVVHANNRRSIATAMCTIKMIENAPWTLWLHERNRSTRSTVSGFRDQILNGLSLLILICCCRMQRPQCNTSDVDLAVCILRCLPFEYNEKLVTEGIQLVDTMISRWRSNRANMTLDVVDYLSKIMGGQPTPQGTLTAMSLPLRMWLLSESGRVLIFEILHGTSSTNTASDCKFVRHALRTMPAIVLSETYTWHYFVEYLDRLEQAGSEEGPALCQSLFEGRKDFSTEALSVHSKQITQDIGPFLEQWLLSPKCDGKQSALVCYGLLYTKDWEALVAVKSFRKPVNYILGLCRDENAGQKIRSESCKCLGEVCSNLLPLHGPTVSQNMSDVCRSFCLAFMEALEDHKNVAYMAMFALGNLARTCSLINSFKLLDADLLISLGSSVTTRLESDDAKLASNTIRAASHTLCLFGKRRSDIPREFLDKTANVVFQNLSSRVLQAVTLGQGKLSLLGWKQRAAVKKLGWGACNAMATVFVGDLRFLFHAGTKFDLCIESLCLCLLDIKLSNDKIVSAAMVALRNINVHTLGRTVEGTSFFVQAMIGICQTLPNAEFKHSKMDAERDKTLAHLMDACSIADARRVVQVLATEELIGILYEWAIQHDVSAENWGKLALAMQRCPSVDVYWEQRFASRAQLLLQPEITDEL